MRRLRKNDRFSCVSRPRRFGKTYAAAMLAAYYDKSCDSHYLFDDLKIAENPKYNAFLNKYNVMYLDMSYFMICPNCKNEISSNAKQKSGSNKVILVVALAVPILTGAFLVGWFSVGKNLIGNEEEDNTDSSIIK